MDTLQVRGLHFTYPKSGTRAIDGIDFDIREGEIFGFLGPSGAGKSTTQRILIRLLQGYGGEITYRGRPLSSYDNEFYQDIGVSFEMPISFSKLTALENLAFFQRLYAQHADVEALMKRVGKADRIMILALFLLQLFNLLTFSFSWVLVL